MWVSFVRLLSHLFVERRGLKNITQFIDQFR